jgi:hypothetical protein
VSDEAISQHEEIASGKKKNALAMTG